MYIAGVGIPMSRRSGFASILKPSSDEEYNLVRLIHCTGITLQLTKEPSIDAVLYKVLLNDLLAALCQLVYGTEQWPEQVQYGMYRIEVKTSLKMGQNYNIFFLPNYQHKVVVWQK